MVNYFYNPTYKRINWQNYTNTDTPLNADNLNFMDSTIERHDKALVAQSTEISSLGTQVSNAITQISTFDGRISNNTSRINSLTTRVSKNETDIQELQDEIEHLDVKTSFSELKDVELTDLQDGDVPIYDSTSQKWKNGKADIGLFVENGLLMCRYSV